jgi:hypothetical protein
MKVMMMMMMVMVLMMMMLLFVPVKVLFFQQGKLFLLCLISRLQRHDYKYLFSEFNAE